MADLASSQMHGTGAQVSEMELERLHRPRAVTGGVAGAASVMHATITPLGLFP